MEQGKPGEKPVYVQKVRKVQVPSTTYEEVDVPYQEMLPVGHELLWAVVIVLFVLAPCWRQRETCISVLNIWRMDWAMYQYLVLQCVHVQSQK
jgi:hypothetical protein